MNKKIILLKRKREADGIVFATPVFFWKLSVQLRALLERYIYPGPLDHPQEVAAIYTMYQPEQVSCVWFTPHADALRMEIQGFLRNVHITELVINDTQSRQTGTSGIYGNIRLRQAAPSEAMNEVRWPKERSC